MRVGRYAAITLVDADGGQDAFGHPADEGAIPSGIRRRMAKLERLVVRCALGVLDGEPTSELIFCSRYGNVETLATLLQGIAEGQLISPMAFSGSVHNAAPGLVGQIRKERLSHTAIAAGDETFLAGLTEAYARLVCEDCADVTLVFADVPLPEIYRDFEEDFAPGLAFAMRLSLGEGVNAIPVRPGRKGVFEILEAIRSGPACLALKGAAWSDLAA